MRTRRIVLLVVAVVAGMRNPAPAVSLDTQGTGTGTVYVCGQGKLQKHSFFKQDHQYVIQGFCSLEVNGGSSGAIQYTVSADWSVAKKTAAESIQAADQNGVPRHITLISSCPDDPWLTGAACTLVSLSDPSGGQTPLGLNAQPFPKSRDAIPPSERGKLLQEAANAPDKPTPPPPPEPTLAAAKAPWITSPAAGAFFSGDVPLTIEGPAGLSPKYSKNYDYQLELQNPKTKTWTQQFFQGTLVPQAKGGHATLPHSDFKEMGAWRVRARVGPLPFTNAWSAWRPFFVVPPLPAAATASMVAPKILLPLAGEVVTGGVTVKLQTTVPGPHDLTFEKYSPPSSGGFPAGWVPKLNMSIDTKSAPESFVPFSKFGSDGKWRVRARIAGPGATWSDPREFVFQPGG